MLQAADFEHELLSANLVYLTTNSEVRVVVMENQAYRFMLMDGTIQSAMDLQDPQALVFAHQQVMLRDLAALAPGARVLELGLGGGSAVRHAQLHGLPLRWTTVEENSEVVNLYWCYFDSFALGDRSQTQTSSAFEHVIELAESFEYLWRLAPHTRFELILCDVYDELSDELIRLCIQHLHPGGELVINWLPHLQSQGTHSGEFFANLADELNLEHAMQTVVGFANQIHRLRLRPNDAD